MAPLAKKSRAYFCWWEKSTDFIEEGGKGTFEEAEHVDAKR